MAMEEWIGHQVSVLTCDGRNIVGTLRGFDQVINIILNDAVERVYSTTSGVEVVQLKLYIVRGDNICCLGLLDEDLDAALDPAQIRGHPIKPILHGAWAQA
eukprot:gnl/Spiro4/10174_TR5407_c0_g1_i1.p1 gnl/Spiro4/10174_TR5407_c0_g1~~gnl/Spiro4/10174_TR5407_c0_g1_i1.p1  ORF type:complete len:101 (+),score=26.98 gnl/Spiro4/10174_TR5407_c0_g1_i1:66-368(+)